MEDGAVDRAVGAFTGRADTPLFIVTVGTADGEISGCLAGFVTQCSILPPRFLVCLSKLNHSFFVGERATGMAIHLLGEDQTELAQLFAEFTGDTFDKFEHCPWHRESSGAPVLDECSAWLDGVPLHHFSAGDHEAFVMSPIVGGAGTHHGAMTMRNSPSFHPAHPPA
jgi:flavin reductase (DIM6/NTAB) family NADH-FMN oxidoreductase RutF